MSTITNRINTVWTSQSGQLRADTNAIAGGMRNVGTGARQGAQGLTLMQQQMRALGTTIRYAFAGTAVFGSMQLVRNLSQLQQQLGLMEALTIGSPQSVSRGIGGFTTQLLEGSVKALTPVQDLNQSVINLLSTVQEVPRNEIVNDVVRLSQAARLTTTDVTELTQGILTMNNAFGRGNRQKDIEKMTELWTRFIMAVPGGQAAGPQIITQMPQIAALARTANISPGATFGLLAGLLRFGFKGPQAGPGLTRLLQTITFTGANVKESEAALSEAGVTTASVKQRGGLWAIRQLIRHAQGLGIGGNLATARRRAMASPTDLIDAGSIRDLGLSGAGIEFLGRVFHRVQGLRAFIAILARASAPADRMSHNLKQDIDDFVRFFEDAQLGAKDFAARWKKVADRSKLAETAQQFEAASLQIATQLEPIINAAAALPRMGAKALTEHPDLAKGVGIAGLTAAGLTLGNIVTGGLLGRGLGRVFRNIPGLRHIGGLLGGGGQGALMAKAAEDAMQNMGSKQLGASPLNPLYVVVVGQLLPDPMAGRDLDKILPGGKKELDSLENIAKRAGNRGIAAAAARFILGKTALGPLGPIGAIIGAGAAISELQHYFWPTKPLGPQKGMINLPHHMVFTPGTRLFGGLPFADVSTGAFIRGGQNARENEIWAARKLHTTFGAIRAIERAAEQPGLKKLLTDSNNELVTKIDKISMQGMDITIVLQTDKGKKTTKVHIPPTTQYSGGRTPGTRGKKKTTKTAHIDLSQL